MQFPSEVDVYVTTGVWQGLESHPFRVAPLQST
jgi:hypothetical protein